MHNTRYKESSFCIHDNVVYLNVVRCLTLWLAVVLVVIHWCQAVLLFIAIIVCVQTANDTENIIVDAGTVIQRTQRGRRSICYAAAGQYPLIMASLVQLVVCTMRRHQVDEQRVWTDAQLYAASFVFLAPCCIHRVNRVNSRNDLPWWQHHNINIEIGIAIILLLL